MSLATTKVNNFSQKDYVDHTQTRHARRGLGAFCELGTQQLGECTTIFTHQWGK